MNAFDAELKDDTLPQTDMVFDRPALEFDSHEWQQQGYTLLDICSPRTSACQEQGGRRPCRSVEACRL